MASLFERLDKMRPPVEEATPPPTEEAKAVSLFERLDKGRLPTPTEEVIKRLGEDSPIEKLRDWLVNYWAKETVTAQEAYTYGPHSIRDKKQPCAWRRSLSNRDGSSPSKRAGATCGSGKLFVGSTLRLHRVPPNGSPHISSQNNPACFFKNDFIDRSNCSNRSRTVARAAASTRSYERDNPANPQARQPERGRVWYGLL